MNEIATYCPIERPPVLNEPEGKSVNFKETSMQQYLQRFANATNDKERDKVLAEFFRANGGISNMVYILPEDKRKHVMAQLEKRMG